MDTAQESRPKPKKRTIVIGIAIVLIVALSVVSVVLLNEAHENGFQRGLPTVPGPIPGGYRVNVDWNSKIPWDVVDILLWDGSHMIDWSNLTTADLTSSEQPITWHFGSAQPLGSLSVWLNVTDVAGDGHLGLGDHFDLTTGGARFVYNQTYTVTLIDEGPPAQQIASWPITPSPYY